MSHLLCAVAKFNIGAYCIRRAGFGQLLPDPNHHISLISESSVVMSTHSTCGLLNVHCDSHCVMPSMKVMTGPSKATK